jgi:hypothetical protein
MNAAPTHPLVARCRATRARSLAEAQRSVTARSAVERELERSALLHDVLALRHAWTAPRRELRYVLVTVAAPSER